MRSLHEASHITITILAEHLEDAKGARVLGQPMTFGCRKSNENPADAATRDAGEFDAVCALVAGPVGERISGSPAVIRGNDCVGVLAAERTSAEKFIMRRIWAGRNVTVKDAGLASLNASSITGKAVRVAEWLLRSHWGGVERIAAYLTRHGSVTGSLAREYLESDAQVPRFKDTASMLSALRGTGDKSLIKRFAAPLERVARAKAQSDKAGLDVVVGWLDKEIAKRPTPKRRGVVGMSNRELRKIGLERLANGRISGEHRGGYVTQRPRPY